FVMAAKPEQAHHKLAQKQRSPDGGTGNVKRFHGPLPRIVRTLRYLFPRPGAPGAMLSRPSLSAAKPLVVAGRESMPPNAALRDLPISRRGARAPHDRSRFSDRQFFSAFAGP